MRTLNNYDDPRRALTTVLGDGRNDRANVSYVGGGGQHNLTTDV